MNLGKSDCPHCHGLGYLRADVPIDHPEFGKIHVCECREALISVDIRNKLYSISNLEKLRHMTFDNFLPRGRLGISPIQGNTLERAYESCLRYAKSLKGWLFITGGYGCGKTHLAAATANFAAELGIPTLFLTVPDLLDNLRFSFDSTETNYEERLSEIKNCQLLVLDDFGTQNSTPWAQEKLFQIINYRYINQLPLLITTNLTYRDLDGRIKSRLEDPEMVEKVSIDAPDFRNPSRDMGFHELSSLDSKNRLTFDSFSFRTNENLSPEDLRSLESAYDAAHEFSREPNGWLILLGPYASGKTHLAASIANELERQGTRQLFVSVPEFLDHLRATFSPNSTIPFDRRFDEVKTSPVLILDDLLTQNMSPWVRDKLYQLFIHRYDSQLPTVITTSDTLEAMDERIRSRLHDKRVCKIYKLQAPPFSGGETVRKNNRRRKKIVT